MFDLIPWNEDKSGGHVTTIGGFLAIAINVLMGILFAASFIAIAMAFIQLITSRGDPKATSKGFTTLTWGVLGVVLSFSILLIKAIVSRLVGIGISDVPNF